MKVSKNVIRNELSQKNTCIRDCIEEKTWYSGFEGFEEHKF
jgi:hypothetical protein